ncbi:MAG: hypothetical protein JWN40_1997 [Phycisphaerales bacterium]|nr:hypothetical protein [Phycisphaerales bacterium]
MRKMPIIGLATVAAMALMFLLNPLTRAGDAAKDAGAKQADPKQPISLLSEADKKLPRDNNYIVHEWGTFTSFAGSNGVSLDFRPLADEDLPKFVMDRPRQAALNQRRDIAYAKGVTGKGLVLSKQRMETPVTYFYTDQERIVDVTVEFPHGLLTEFFPPVRQFGPAFKPDVREPLTGSWLRWGNIRLLPKSKQAPLNEKGVDPYLRQVEPGENPHYAYARETDSNQIQIDDPASMTTSREKFLFYRGVGNFDLPVRVTASGGDRFTFTHSGKTPLHYAFLVQIDHGVVRFARYDQIPQSIDMMLPSQPSTLDALSDEMIRALVSDGLFDKEARAMVKTWKSSWFGEQGTRVLYGLAQGDTDALLPLHLSPAPKEIVRVMIGRLETLTPEQESTIESLVAHLGDDDPAIRTQTAVRLKELGRFAEPALTRVAATSNDPEVQVKSQTLLRRIAAGKEQTDKRN